MSATTETQAVVTRFAPSPTGYLHIGSARTALFNWLFARHHGGKFLLRIEDTDKVRSTQQAIDAIVDGMHWLGLDWDDTTHFQSEFAARHSEIARTLLESGHAYRCYMSQEELQEMRAAADAERRPFRVRSPWRDCAPPENPEERPYVVRIRASQEGETVIEDQVQGRVAVQNSEVDDFILLRSDGSPTYMLAVVVDDHDMGVTHVIRGDDHLSNTFRQLAIIRAMGWPDPVYAHVPMIHGPDGGKMSKRHGATGVEAYRDELGILPEAMVNYLLRLGWGHGDDEIISREDAVRWFTLDHVGRSPSRFDMKKLENLNGHYIREADNSRLAALVAAETGRFAGRDLGEDDVALLTQAMAVLKPRAKNLHELAEGGAFLFKNVPLDLDDRAAGLLEGRATELLAHVHVALTGLSENDWTAEAAEGVVKKVAEDAGVKLGQVAQPLRAALTGRATSPGIFDVLVLLGREESLARVADRMTR